MGVNFKVHMGLYLNVSDSESSNSACMYIEHAVRLGRSVGGLFCSFNGAVEHIMPIQVSLSKCSSNATFRTPQV